MICYSNFISFCISVGSGFGHPQNASQSDLKYRKREKWLGSLLKQFKVGQQDFSPACTSPIPSLQARQCPFRHIYFREGTHDGDGYHTLNVARRDALGEFLMPCRLPYNGGTVSCSSPAKGELNGKRVSVWIVSYQLANDQVSCGKAYQSTEVWQNKLAKVQEAILWMFATSCQNGVLTYYCSTEDPRCESVRRKKQKTSD